MLKFNCDLISIKNFLYNVCNLNKNNVKFIHINMIITVKNIIFIDEFKLKCTIGKAELK